MMTDEESQDHSYYSFLLRGLVITQMSALEKAIESYLCTYFTNESSKQLELLELLLDRMTFDGKRTAFEAILKKNNTPADYKKHYKAMIEDLRKLIVKRNQFAHYIFDDGTAVDNLKHYSIGLIEYRNHTKTIWYTDEDVTNIVNGAYTIMQKIHSLESELSKNV